MEIGDRIIVKHLGLYGTIVDGPQIVLGVENFGVKFDDKEFNEIFCPHWYASEVLEKV